MKLHPIVFYAVAVLGMGSCHSDNLEIQMPTQHIAVVSAYEKEIPMRIQFVGQTYSAGDVTIQPRVSGYLLSTHFDEGMPVKKGQLLFRIDSDQISVELAKAVAMLASAKSQLVDAQSDYDRSVPLARIKAISQSTLDQATATLASAMANVLSAEASKKSVDLKMSYTTIYAPMDGVIGGTMGSVGDYVGVGTNNPILNTISDISSISVHLSIPMSRYLSIIERDDINRPEYDNENLLSDIEMSLANGEVYPYKGKYAHTERLINTSTGSVVIHVSFPNPEEYLALGEYVRVNANVGRSMDVVLVPQRSVIQSQTMNTVFVVGKDSIVQYREVKLGNTYRSEWQIISGLEPEEMVLTEGLQKVHTGMKIVPVFEPIVNKQ